MATPKKLPTLTQAINTLAFIAGISGIAVTSRIIHKQNKAAKDMVAISATVLNRKGTAVAGKYELKVSWTVGSTEYFQVIYPSMSEAERLSAQWTVYYRKGVPSKVYISKKPAQGVVIMLLVFCICSTLVASGQISKNK
jgi:hypothetical protein